MRMCWLAIVLVGPGLVAAAGVSEENRWLGGDAKAPTDWAVPANWSAGVAPSAAGGGDAVIGSATVHVTADAAVAGNLVIAGGHVIVAAGKTLTIRGDLVFRGKGPGGCLTPNGEVLLRGTVTCESAASCLAPSAGWVTLVGQGDQAISAAGVLPPIRIRKPSGKVAPSGDLHCMGLHVCAGNTLDLSRGQRLAFGSTEREWHVDPKEKLIVKTYLPFRSSKDLVNEGTIEAGSAVPFTLYANADGKLYAVTGGYEAPRGSSGGLRARNVSINAPDSRLILKDGKLTLDGKPVAAGAAGGLEEASGEKARLTGLAVREVAPAKLDLAGLVNIAPCVQRLKSAPSVGHDVWNAVDGSPQTAATFRTGVGRGGSFEFIFSKPVTVSAVRFRQGGLFAIRYSIRADTDGDGRYETPLVESAGGFPEGWREHAFAATTVRGLELRGIEGQRGWEQSYPQLCEMEIYADRASSDTVAAEARKPAPVPDGVKWLVAGPTPAVQAQSRPAAGTAPADRILKGVMVDYWMFGIHDERSITFQHLRDYEPFRKLLTGVKDLGADTVTLFVEAVPMVCWPSRNFRSLTNQQYFRDLARQVLPVAGKAADSGKDDLGLEEPGAAKKKPAPPDPARPPEIDPPVKTDILKEFCQAMHESGIRVLVLFRGRIMENYIGPPGVDAWTTLSQEVAERSADGVYVMGDEEWFGLANPKGATLPAEHPDRLEFRKRWGPGSDLPKGWENTANYRKHVLLNYEKAGLALRARRDAVRKINPQCLTLVNVGSHSITANNRMTYGTAYDILGHLGELDFFGTDYVPQETRTFAAASAGRQATMILGAGEPIGSAVSCIMQGARAVSYYRFNYIDLWKATDRRRAGFQLLRSLEGWGVASARPPRKIALLLSRASEDWWDNACGTFWLGESDRAKQGFWTSRLVNDWLLRGGYPFDLYYLDQLDDLRAAGQYKLLIVPFPYSVSRGAADILGKALAGGTKMLIAQKRGEVDEYGMAHDKPVLDELIGRGVKQGNVAWLDDDLVARETDRTFDEWMSAAVDGLLGPDKPLTFRGHGSRVEAQLVEKPGREWFLALINPGDEAAVEVGLPLPKGRYRVSVLSSTAPAEAKPAVLAGRDELTEEDLAGFAVRLAKEETQVFRVVAASRPPS